MDAQTYTCPPRSHLRRPHKPRTPLDAFQSLPEGTRVQLIEDIMVVEPAPVYLHQHVLLKLSRKMAAYVEDHHLGEIVVAPLDVYLNGENVFQPDIL